MRSAWLALFVVGLWGCGGSGGGSGNAVASNPAPSNSVPIVESVQVGTPVVSTRGGGLVDGPVTSGDAGVVDVAPPDDAPYARMQVWLQVNVSEAAVEYYDWQIKDWAASPPNGLLTNYDSIINLDRSNGVYEVRTTANRIRYDSSPIIELRSLDSSFSQTVVVTAWTSEGRFASAYFTVNLTKPAGSNVDTNTNGISDVWEAAYSVMGADPMADDDRDGQNNYQESVAGTDPNDPQSVFRVEAIESKTAGYLVRWNSIAGKLYQVETTASLTGGEWMSAGLSVVGTGEEVLAVVPVGDPPFEALRLNLVVDDSAFLEGRAFLPDVDTDGDGFADADEWAAGTDPFDAASRLAVGSIGFGRAVVLKWPSVKGKLYQVQSSPTAVAGSWSTSGGWLQGNGSGLTAAAEATGNREFFRVRVMDADEDLDGITDWEEQLTGLDTGPFYYRTNFPTDPALVTAVVTATNRIRVEPGSPVADATTGTPGSFRVIRSGNLNALTINYTVSGDAVAGVDYEALPGSVTLPAGVNAAEIPVLPLSEAGLDPARSVIVTLQSGMGFLLETNGTARVNVLREAGLSVADFGAVGDGVTDDTAAIQAAIDALEASTSHNTLHFPAGTYRLNTTTAVMTPVTSWQQLLSLGASDLAGRDLLITGEPGAELYSTVSWVRARMLAVKAKFRTLTFRGLTWRKDDTPLPPTSGEPNGADGVSLLRYDLRRVESVEFQNCTFVNCHGAVFAYNNGYDARGKLAQFDFQHCQVLNPYGSNTRNGAAAFGGGQQVQLSQWVGRAVYSDNLFDGGPDGPPDPILNPGGDPKDGSHFGSPLELVFTNNIVRHMGVEAIFQTDDPTMGVLQEPFVVPPADGTTTVEVLLKPDFLTTYIPGQILNLRTPATQSSAGGNLLLTVVSYDEASRTLTLKNDGLTDGASGAEVLAPLPIYLQKYAPTIATIADNVFENDGNTRIGFIAVAATAKATITRNFIKDFLISVQLYQNGHNVLFPPTPGTRVDSNVILTADPRDSVNTTYGVQSWGPGEIIANNFIATPVSTHFVGLAMRGRDSWAEANTLLPAEVARHSYEDINRSVGVGVGNFSTNTVSVANRTSGLDVGIGPIASHQSVPHRVISHFSTNDELAVDPHGLTDDSQE